MTQASNADGSWLLSGPERLWKHFLEVQEGNLQLAESSGRVVELMRQTLASVPGVGPGAIFLARGDKEFTCVGSGIESVKRSGSDTLAEQEKLARRAVHEARTVECAGLYAVPLGPAGHAVGAVVTEGDPEAIERFLVHAGRALVREVRREGEQSLRDGATGFTDELERSLEILEALVRGGDAADATRGVVNGVARLPWVAGVSAWVLRPEDGAYREVAGVGTRNGCGRGGPPELPGSARRGEGFPKWLGGLPRWSGYGWVAHGSRTGACPVARDMLVASLGNEARPLPDGAILILLSGAPDAQGAVESLRRWTTLASLSLESGTAQSLRHRDLEKLRAENEHLNEIYRMKSRFIAAVSHELRTPLTSISAYAETLRDTAAWDDPTTRTRFLDVIRGESDRLSRIVDDILDLATMESGRMRMACRRIALGDVVACSADVIRPIADEAGVRLVLPESIEAMVHADADLLKQVVVNLLENAVKFSAEGGEVRLCVDESGASVRISVEDSGAGIPADQLDLVFEQFYQVDGSNTRQAGGTGLGLAICRRIVTWHDGRIWAESEEGGGARFVVSLPSRRATACGPVAGIVEMEPEETHRIPELIVEMISEVMGVDIVSLMLTDPSSEELHIHAAVGLPVEVVRDVRVGIGERICGVVARTGETLLIPDLAVDGRFESAHPTRYRTKSVLSTPVKIGGRVVGVLNVCDKRTGDTFTEHDRRLVELLSERVALILGKIREHARSPESLRNMENSLRCVIDVRRHYHPSGSDFDRTLLAVCGELDVPPREASLIHYAGMMRDIGMAKIPDGIYRRSTPLGSGGREIVERHPEEGAKALRPIEFLQDVFDIVISHHEGEGGGYPRGLPLGRIPRGGKILAVVDAYHALRSDRPHRKAEDREWALNTLREGVGTKYDGVVVEALARVLDANGSEGTNQSHGSGS